MARGESVQAGKTGSWEATMHSPRGPEPTGSKRAENYRNEMSVAVDGTELPRELLREVAASLRSLSKVVPYEEYALIVHRIARVRWQCEHIKNTRSADAAVEQSEGHTQPETSDETLMRFWDAALAYGGVEMAPSNHALLERARDAQKAAQESRARVVADRERRSADIDARTRLRDASREYVARLKDHGDTIDDVLRSTGTILRSLRALSGLSDEQGTFEVEVQRIVAEEYFSAA